MDQYRLDGIHAKLDRADEHLVALTDELRVFIESQPHAYRTHVNYAEGSYSVRISLQQPPPIRLAILCGDYVHCLRCALDHVIRGVVPKPTRRTAFPICQDAGQFDQDVRNPAVKGARGRVTGINPNGALFAYIERTQPYNGGHGISHHPLWLLEQLWSADKHRAILTLAQATGRATDLRVGGDGIQFIGKARYLYDVELEDGAEIISGKFRPILEGQPKVEVQGVVPVDVAFGEDRVPSSALHMLRDAAREVVAGVLRYATVS